MRAQFWSAAARAVVRAERRETASLTADSQRAAPGQRGAVHLHGVAGGQAGANDQGFRDRRQESEGSHGAVQEILYRLELRREGDRLVM